MTSSSTRDAGQDPLTELDPKYTIKKYEYELDPKYTIKKSAYEQQLLVSVTAPSLSLLSPTYTLIT